MSCLNKYQWEVVPENLPIVKRSCPKCNEKTNYINSEKFRINANKNRIDIWSIYKCENCKSTWNMTIYDRINLSSISKYEYNKFLLSDREFVRKYAFNISLYSKNKAEVSLEKISYKVVQRKLEACYIKENELVIEIICKYPIDLRADRLLSDILGVSRNKIKGMLEKGRVFVNDNRNPLNIRVRDGMEIHVLQEVENSPS